MTSSFLWAIDHFEANNVTTTNSFLNGITSLFFSYQEQAIANSEQHIVYAFILLYILIKCLDGFPVFTFYRLFQHLSVKHHIIGQNQAIFSYSRQHQLIVIYI